MKLVKTLWGMTELETHELWLPTLRRIKSDGFEAIEASPNTLRPFAGSYAVLRDHLDAVGLAIIVHVGTQFLSRHHRNTLHRCVRSASAPYRSVP